VTPIIIRRYLWLDRNRFISPGLSMASSTNFDTIPVGSLVAVVVHACKGYNFEPASDGSVPADYRASLSDFTGTPSFAIKTRTDWQTPSTAFAGVFNGYYGALTSLATGVAAVSGILPQATTTAELDYMAQLRFLDASGNPMSTPGSPLPVSVRQPVVVGDETGAPATPTTYSATVTILEGTDYLDVPIAGLTVATGTIASLTQQDNGNGLTTLWGTITANNLRISAGGEAPVNGWKVYYALGSL